MNALMWPFHCQAYPLSQIMCHWQCHWMIWISRLFQKKFWKECGIKQRIFAPKARLWKVLHRTQTQNAVVASKSSHRPHIIKQSKSGQFSCESSCLMWHSSKICVHCIAAAEYSHQLEEYLKWYKSSKTKPNLSKLSNADMPKRKKQERWKAPKKEKQKKCSLFFLSWPSI